MEEGDVCCQLNKDDRKVGLHDMNELGVETGDASRRCLYIWSNALPRRGDNPRGSEIPEPVTEGRTV